MSSTNPSETPNSDADAAESVDRKRPLGGFITELGRWGRGLASRVLGSPLDQGAAVDADSPAPDTPPQRESALKRMRVLHDVAETLRGAADGFIAAKLDEFEARVDLKLDQIEERIDRKTLELHQQLRELRDRELRHRLRMLKITLIFTVLVAALSLAYKWLSGVIRP